MDTMRAQPIGTRTLITVACLLKPFLFFVFFSFFGDSSSISFSSYLLGGPVQVVGGLYVRSIASIKSKHHDQALQYVG